MTKYMRMFFHKYRLPLCIIAGLLILGGVWWFASQTFQRNQNKDEINSFEECVESGNPVMESYPPQCRIEDRQSFTQDIGNELELSDEVVIENPRPNQTIVSPLIVKGRARGTFYFEGSFPIRLVDERGNELAESYVESQGEWMTEDFVPFIGELEFQTDATSGTLYFEKANPSGLPENEQVLEVPIQF